MTPGFSDVPEVMRTVSEAQLLSVLDTAVDGIIVIDVNARMLVFNKACEQLFGYTAAEAIGQNVSLLVPSDFVADHDAYIHRYLDTGERRIIGIGREVRGRHKDGTSFPFELSVGEAVTPAGRQFIGIIKDLRPRKAVENRINQLQAQLVHMARVNAMDEMGAAIAHELNQPLTAVILYLQAILRKMGTSMADEPGVGPLMDILTKAVREAERAGSIIQRMRQFVEKREPARQSVDLRKLMDEALELTMLGNSVPDLEVFREEDDDLPDVEVDPVQIQQVMVNLIRNAFEAVRNVEPCWIKIALYREDVFAVVSIEDSGAGIPKEVVRNLFKAFSSSKKTGLGLGLAISRSIAQNHGGELTVAPGGSGSGARFVLSLPLAVPARPSSE